MNSIHRIKLTVTEFCESVPVSRQTLEEMVSEGVFDVPGTATDDWVFDAEMLTLIRKALRLKSELDIDWAGIAVALDLLMELDQLRRENRQLKSQLSRFLLD